MIDKNLLKKRFSKAAMTYDNNTPVQEKAIQFLIDQIKIDSDKTPVNPKILEIGCGTGQLTRLIPELFNDARITAIDIAEGMINTAKINTSGKHIEFIKTDAENWLAEHSFDRILSTSTFQWFHNPLQVIIKYGQLLEPQGLLHISTFGTNTFQELTAACKAIKGEMGNSIISANFIDKKQIVQQLKFHNFHCQTRTIIIHHSYENPKVFFNSLRQIGANSNSPSKIAGNVPYIRNIIRYLENHNIVEDRLLITYEIVMLKTVRIVPCTIYI